MTDWGRHVKIECVNGVLEEVLDHTILQSNHKPLHTKKKGRK